MTQVRTAHLRLLKAVRDDPMRRWARDPLGSSKAKDREESWLSLKDWGFRTQEGGCLIVREAYAGLYLVSSLCRVSAEKASEFSSLPV